MAITDLTGYTWTGNDIIDYSNGMDNKNINFICDNDTYSIFNMYLTDPGDYTLQYNKSASSTVHVYESVFGGWQNVNYRTIQITGGTDATNATLISYLEANGTLTPPVTGYSITYHANGGIPTPENLTNQTEIPTHPEISKDGYAFVGWYLDSEFTQRAVVGTELTEDIDLYAKFTTLTGLFTDIADVIREKKGTTDDIKAVDFVDELKDIPTGPNARGEEF